MRTRWRPFVALACLGLLLCASLVPGSLGPAVLVVAFLLGAVLLSHGPALEPVLLPAPSTVRRSCPPRAPPLR